MHDYVHCICPQFTETDINFQRVPVVDTSNPFIARWIPTADESIVVIRFRDPHGIDFPYLVSMIHDSWMSRANSIVIPGGKLDLAMQLVRLSGLRPNKDIEIKYTGIRPGEKLYEELFDQNESLLKTTISDIKLVSSSIKQTAGFAEKLEQLEEAVDKQDKEATLKHLSELVPTFRSRP